MIKNTSIVVSNLSKKFKRNPKHAKNALARLGSFFSANNQRDFWVLKNISFTVNAKENVGIIGRNGSGKTTLLRTVAGIYQPDLGKVEINGKAVLLSSMASGLKSRLTVKDNVYLVGSILGLGQKDIENKFTAIIGFAGLDDFINTQIYQLSSGMKQRLAFAITINCLKKLNPDILLLDEVFTGGGDEEFKIKALIEIEKLIKGGLTIILVSHKMNLIKNYCNKVIWLDQGKIIKQGEPEKVINQYLLSIKKND